MKQVLETALDFITRESPRCFHLYQKWLDLLRKITGTWSDECSRFSLSLIGGISLVESNRSCGYRYQKSRIWTHSTEWKSLSILEAGELPPKTYFRPFPNNAFVGVRHSGTHLLKCRFVPLLERESYESFFHIVHRKGEKREKKEEIRRSRLSLDSGKNGSNGISRSQRSRRTWQSKIQLQAILFSYNPKGHFWMHRIFSSLPSLEPSV